MVICLPGDDRLAYSSGTFRIGLFCARQIEWSPLCRGKTSQAAQCSSSAYPRETYVGLGHLPAARHARAPQSAITLDLARRWFRLEKEKTPGVRTESATFKSDDFWAKCLHCLRCKASVSFSRSQREQIRMAPSHCNVSPRAPTFGLAQVSTGVDPCHIIDRVGPLRSHSILALRLQPVYAVAVAYWARFSALVVSDECVIGFVRTLTPFGTMLGPQSYDDSAPRNLGGYSCACPITCSAPMIRDKFHRAIVQIRDASIILLRNHRHLILSGLHRRRSDERLNARPESD